MRRTISVALPHDLGEEEAKRRLAKGFSDARTKYPAYLQHAREAWNGNTMEFTASAIGQTVSGRVQVEAKRLLIHIDLPLLLAVFAEHILPHVESEGRRLLSGPPQ